ncbi:cupin domain-containing protein [Gandjariella thermophila]|uniref:16.7 kDa protein in whiE locus n=1 Tax=Gandjariella thermophila TaxID=1931992 RepID=A0A4D4J525_9PSEU|nr:cupin domain-containing protein [Gandjariella thermophila]GDY29709.1 16.7 kDa protein in whiE locus [Gandjariella thermophila]
MTAQTIRVVSVAEITPNTRRGGDIRVLLGPATVGATTGFLGVAIIQPGERIAEHYHPYSEEFLYVTDGELTVDLDGVPHHLAAGQGLLVPKEVRHRLRNTGDVEARAVFHLCPLAPRPELGHVDTEQTT